MASIVTLDTDQGRGLAWVEDGSERVETIGRGKLLRRSREGLGVMVGGFGDGGSVADPGDSGGKQSEIDRTRRIFCCSYVGQTARNNNLAGIEKVGTSLSPTLKRSFPRARSLRRLRSASLSILLQRKSRLFPEVPWEITVECDPLRSVKHLQ